MNKTLIYFSNQINFNDMFGMKYEEAFETILKSSRVGPKVADCILLYGFGFRKAFPSDVWIKELYPHYILMGRYICKIKVREFGINKFGIMQDMHKLYYFIMLVNLV